MFYTADDAKSLTFNKIKASIPQYIIDRVHAAIEQAIANKQFCCIIDVINVRILYASKSRPASIGY